MRMIVLALLLLLISGSIIFYLASAPAKLKVNVTQMGIGHTASGEDELEPQAREITYNHVEGGYHKWGLVASGGNYDMASNIIYLKDVRLVFYPEGGGEINLRADEGEYHQEEQCVVLTGNVKGRNDKDVNLETQKITYTEANGLVDTDEPVLVYGPTFRINGVGMQVYVSTQHITFKERVDSTFLPGVGSKPKAAANEGTPEEELLPEDETD